MFYNYITIIVLGINYNRTILYFNLYMLDHGLKATAHFQDNASQFLEKN
jgi:hypothetical protein